MSKNKKHWYNSLLTCIQREVASLVIFLINHTNEDGQLQKSHGSKVSSFIGIRFVFHGSHDVEKLSHTQWITLKRKRDYSEFRSHTELLNYFCEVPLRGSVARCTYFAVNIISNQTCVS